jgi:hypothetical protein
LSGIGGISSLDYRLFSVTREDETYIQNLLNELTNFASLCKKAGMAIEVVL